MSPHTTNQLPAVIRDAIDAANGHDTDAFLACFAEDGAVDDWGSLYRGHDEIRTWSNREFIGVGVILADVVGARESESRIAIRTRVGGNGYNGSGTFTFTVKDDLVTLMHITA